MIIKGHWGGVGPLRLPWIYTDPERFENLRWTLPETSCMTSTFKHLASCCPLQKKTYMFNPPEKYVQIGNLPPSFGVQIPSVYLKPPNGFFVIFQELILFQGTDCKQFSADLLGTCHLQKGQFWQFSPWEDVKKTTSITSPNDGLPWLASTRPRCCLLRSSFFSYTYTTTILGKFHPFLPMSVSTSVNDFANLQPGINYEI